jgi:hypothetical protein
MAYNRAEMQIPYQFISSRIVVRACIPSLFSLKYSSNSTLYIGSNYSLFQNFESVSIIF